jgi:hypothetical protein
MVKVYGLYSSGSGQGPLAGYCEHAMETLSKVRRIS